MEGGVRDLERMHARCVGAASLLTGLAEAEICIAGRGAAEAAFARQLVMYPLHICGELSLSEVGRLVGRDRTTVTYAVTRVEDARDDPVLDERLDSVDALLRPLLTGDRVGAGS